MHILTEKNNQIFFILPVWCALSDVSKAKKKKQQTPSSATVMELVSTKRQGVAKQVKRLQGRLGPGKSKATVKDKRIKSAVGQSALLVLNGIKYAPEIILILYSSVLFF